MAEPRSQPSALLVMAAFSRHESLLARARVRLEQVYARVGLASPAFDFNQTTYYERTMGPGLKKQFLAFRELVAPERLADIKLHTNDLEHDLAKEFAFPEPRPINLDPGLLFLGKFVLATTKDQGHRIYLRNGIFAEVTLRYQAGAWEPWPWTYADYREAWTRDFLESARTYYRSRLTEKGAEAGA